LFVQQTLWVLFCSELGTLTPPRRGVTKKTQQITQATPMEEMDAELMISCSALPGKVANGQISQIIQHFQSFQKLLDPDSDPVDLSKIVNRKYIRSNPHILWLAMLWNPVFAKATAKASWDHLAHSSWMPRLGYPCLDVTANGYSWFMNHGYPAN
jgi:hypothetical protein